MASPPLKKHVSIAEAVEPQGSRTEKGTEKGSRRRVSRGKAVLRSAAKVNMLYKHLSHAVVDAHLDESSSDDGVLTSEEMENFLLFCPALQAWIRTTQGVSAKEAFLAWARWAKSLKSQEKTVGGTEEPTVGMYVMPSKTAPQSMHEDAGATAGKLTKIAQGDDGKLSVFVRWAESGLERSYELPNKWEMMMATTSGREPPNFVLTLATEEDIEMAVQQEQERAFFDSMADEHLQIFKSHSMRKFDPLSPSRKRDLYERTGTGNMSPYGSPRRLASNHSSPRDRWGRNSAGTSRHASISPRRATSSRRSSPVIRPSSPSIRPSSPSPNIRPSIPSMWPSSPSMRPSSPIPSMRPSIPSMRPSNTTVMMRPSRSSKNMPIEKQSSPLAVPMWPRSSGARLASIPRNASGQSEPNERLASGITSEESCHTHRSGYAESYWSEGDETGSPSVQSMKSGVSRRDKVPSLWHEGLKKWKALREGPRPEKKEKPEKPVTSDSESLASPSSSSFAEDVTTFTGFYGEDWGDLRLDADVRDNMLDAFFKECCVPVKRRVVYTEMLPRQRPKSAQHARPKKELPTPNLLFCRGMSDKEISLLPSAVLLGTTLFRNCVIVCAQDAAPISRSHKDTNPTRLAQALIEQDITTLCVKDIWQPIIVKRFIKVITRSMEILDKKPARAKVENDWQEAQKNPLVDNFTSVAQWMLRPQTYLSCLSLQRILLGKQGSKMLVDGILNNPASRLETIYCLHNELQDEGLMEMIRAIKPKFDVETEQWITPNKLKSISLIHNRIRNEGAAALAKAVEKHPALIHLDLSKNEIGSAGGDKLAEMVRTNVVLISLLLVDNQIHTAGSLSFATALKTAPGSSHLTVVTGTAQNPRISRRPVKSGDSVPDSLSDGDTTRDESEPSTPGTLSRSRIQTVSPSYQSEEDAGWRSQVKEDTLLWRLCEGELKKQSYLSNYGISNLDEATHKSERDELAESYQFNQKERINSIESQRYKIIQQVIHSFSVNSREVARAGQIISEMKDARSKLLAETGQLTKDRRYGWEEKVDTLQAEAEWFTREIARREASKGGNGVELDAYDKLLHLLYVKDMILLPGQENDKALSPTPEFLEEMSLVLSADEDFRKRQELRRIASAPKETGPPPFPHPDWQRGFHFEIDKCNPALHIKARHTVKNLPDGSSTGGWKCAILTPPISIDSASSIGSPKVTSKTDARGSYMEVRVMNCQDQRRCFVMLGLARGKLSMIASHIFDGKAGCALPCAVMFALHNGCLYRQGKAAGRLAPRGALERDRVGLWVNAKGSQVKAFINEKEVGSIDLDEILPRQLAAKETLQVMSAKAGKLFLRSESAIMDPAENDNALHFVVDLGIEGQELEIIQ